MKPTFTPSFGEILRSWLPRQPWYRGGPGLRPIGFPDFEDPAGGVGMRAFVMWAGGVVYNVPTTYRGAPLDGGALIETAEHSELGPQWIYQAETDPVWHKEILRLVRSNADIDYYIRGELLADFTDDEVDIELARIPTDPGQLDDVVGVVTVGRYRLATVRRKR